jgi:hypothetical protein
MAVASSSLVEDGGRRIQDSSIPAFGLPEAGIP